MKVTRCERPIRQPRGFSLVEVMVGMVIALIGMVIMMKLFADAESAKRNVSGGGDAQANGAIALYGLARELRFAGYGLTGATASGAVGFGSAALGCDFVAYRSDRVPTDIEVANLAPVKIFPYDKDAVTGPDIGGGTQLPLGDAGSDMVMVVYGNADAIGEQVAFNDATAVGNKAGYEVQRRSSFRVGDFVLAAESGKKCSLFKITALPGGADDCNVQINGPTNIIRFPNTTFKDPYAACRDAAGSKYNKAAPLESYSATGLTANLMNLGSAPRLTVFAIRGRSLTECDVLTKDCSRLDSWVSIAPNIIALQARYGWDTTTPADGIVDEYSATLPTALSAISANTHCQISRISAIGIAVLAQNTQFDKEEVTKAGDASTDDLLKWGFQPEKAGDLYTSPGGQFDLSGVSDWTHYRYRKFETTIPLRNMVWKGKAEGGC